LSAQKGWAIFVQGLMKVPARPSVSVAKNVIANGSANTGAAAVPTLVSVANINAAREFRGRRSCGFGVRPSRKGSLGARQRDAAPRPAGDTIRNRFEVCGSWSRGIASNWRRSRISVCAPLNGSQTRASEAAVRSVEKSFVGGNRDGVGRTR